MTRLEVTTLCISGEESPCGLARDCSRETRTGLTLHHPPALLPSLLRKGLDFFSSETSEVLLLAGLVSREATAPVGRLLCFRIYPGAFPNTHPTFPQHGLAKHLPCPGCRWRSVLMSPNFCLSLQPLSTAGVLSSASTASNRSRSRPRYRTKALSSEVDESLFGAVKVMVTQSLQGAVTWRQ